MTTAIEFENISKQYRLGLVSTGTLSHDLNRFWQTKVLRREDPYLKVGEVNDRAHKGDSEYVWALKDINFNVEQGDVVGIIGRNGAGKSTLLKLLSRVTAPTTGTIRARGRIASLLEVGTGFHPEMTGRENIYMNGAIMGMSRAEITRKLDEIVDFSGCERYLDTPVKRYSSGMTVRLGFAIAAHLEPEILVVDEVLAVGDAEFQKKAIGKMQDVSRGEGRTVLFVSHNMGSMRQLCKIGILLNQGQISYSGSIEETISFYLASETNQHSYQASPSNAKNIRIQSVQLLNQDEIPCDHFQHTDEILIDIKIKSTISAPETFLLISILDYQNRKIFSAETPIFDTKRLKIHSPFLTRGHYSIQTIIYRPAVTVYEQIDKICSFDIVDAGSEFAKLETFDYGCVFGSYDWIDK